MATIIAERSNKNDIPSRAETRTKTHREGEEKGEPRRPFDDRSWAGTRAVIALERQHLLMKTLLN